VRRFVKPAVWAGVFLVCAGAGAFIAANSDPFPPGVDRPTGTGATGATGATGSTGATGPSTSPGPVEERWAGPMLVVARHDLYVGGTCRSRWDTTLRLVIEADRSVAGTGAGAPVAPAACDFDEAQAEAKRVRMTVVGRLTPAGVLKLSFEDVQPVPAGSTDLGGFLVFLENARLSIGEENGVPALFFRQQRDDGNRGTYHFDGSVQLGCRSGCGG
jgi:hypothetical protein